MLGRQVLRDVLRGPPVDREADHADPLLVGRTGPQPQRAYPVDSWQRLFENENFYAHPIEGLNAVIDLKTGEIIRVDDYGVVPVPQQQANYEHQFIKTPRAALKPINVVQPEGVNFTLEEGSF